MGIFPPADASSDNNVFSDKVLRTEAAHSQPKQNLDGETLRIKAKRLNYLSLKVECDISHSQQIMVI